MKEGVYVALHRADDTPSGLRLRLLSKDPREMGAWLVAIERDAGEALREGETHDTQLLDAIGRPPLPPYIVRARKHSGQDKSQD
jgi:S-adenosylmethionine:tRNA-ribosyltransferase-isomerase (queuine synthetase)